MSKADRERAMRETARRINEELSGRYDMRGIRVTYRRAPDCDGSFSLHVVDIDEAEVRAIIELIDAARDRPPSRGDS